MGTNAITYLKVLDTFDFPDVSTRLHFPWSQDRVNSRENNYSITKRESLKVTNVSLFYMNWLSTRNVFSVAIGQNFSASQCQR